MTAAAQAGGGREHDVAPAPGPALPALLGGDDRSRTSPAGPGPARRSCARRPTVPTSPACSPSRTPTTCSPRAPCGPRSCASPRTGGAAGVGVHPRRRRRRDHPRPGRPGPGGRACWRTAAPWSSRACTAPGRAVVDLAGSADRRAGPPRAGERVPHPAGRPRLRGALRHPRRLRRADRRRQALAGAPSGRRSHRRPTTSGPATRKRSPRPPTACRRWTGCSPPVTSCTCRAAGSTPHRPRRRCRCT